MSGCTKTDKHCKAGEFKETETLLTEFMSTSSVVENGIRTYTWEAGPVTLSTRGIGQTIIRAYVDGNDVQVPVTLSWQRITGSSEGNVMEITAKDTSLGAVYSYEILDQPDFTLTHTECELAYNVRVMYSFQTTGQEAFDNDYLEETLFDHSSLRLGYFKDDTD